MSSLDSSAPRDAWSPTSAGPPGRGGAHLLLALAVATLTRVTIRPAADAVFSLAIAGLIGLFCYLSQDRRQDEAHMVIGQRRARGGSPMSPVPRRSVQEDKAGYAQTSSASRASAGRTSGPRVRPTIVASRRRREPTRVNVTPAGSPGPGCQTSSRTPSGRGRACTPNPPAGLRPAWRTLSSHHSPTMELRVLEEILQQVVPSARGPARGEGDVSTLAARRMWTTAQS